MRLGFSDSFGDGDKARRSPCCIPALKDIEQMQSADHWQSLFEGWPATIPPEGIVVTSFQESIPFNNFMVGEGLIVLNRDKPDSSGARKVILAYAEIAALKVTATFDLDRFQELGFRNRHLI